jgi:hypothetical protein
LILAELLYPNQVEKFRCNRKFRDHVRYGAATVTDLAELSGVARVTGEFMLLVRPALPT